MNNKKVQAQMQVNVSFVSDAGKLVKDLESKMSNLHLNSTFTKGIETELSKSFKNIYTNLDKMSEGLSKKGLSSKQYMTFFDSVNKRVEDSTKLFGALKKSLEDAFNSDENKKALKDLETYKKQLEEINKLASSQKGADTRRSTAITKMKDETGLDYNISKRSLTQIAARKANGQGLTKNQQDWLSSNGLDEKSLNRALELLKQINAQTEKINHTNAQAKGITGQTNVGAAQDYLNKQINNTSPYLGKDFKADLKLVDQLGENITDVSNLADSLTEGLNKELPKATQQAQELAQAGMTIKEVLGQFGIVLSAAGIARQIKELVQYSYEFYKSLDSALNAIYVVSDLSSEAVNNLTQNFINMAKTTGMSIDDITKSAVLFYQQGLSTDEVLTMTEVTSQFAKVAGIDATDAADKLTAAVNGYCLAAADAASVADKFNQVAAASAADINELSTAFSKAAAQANQAGVSMDNYLAYIATMEEATREAPENIGTSLKTIFSRMQQIKTGENTEDDTDVNNVETALKSVGVQLRDTEGQLRDLEDIFDELGPKWNQLDRNTQAYLGTIIAGTRQQSRFITLMQNWDRVLELSAESENSAGMQALMHAKAMESIESKTQQMTVAWQEFVSNLSNSEAIKTVVTLLTNLLNTVNKAGSPMMILGTAFVLFRKQIQSGVASLVKWTKNLLTSLSATNKQSKSLKGLIGNIKKDTKTYIENTKEISKNNKIIKENIAKLEELQKKKKALEAQGIGADDAEYQKITAEMNELGAATDSLNLRNETLLEQNKQVEGTMDGLTNVAAGLSVAFMAASESSNSFVAGLGMVGTFASQAGVMLFQGIKMLNAFSAAAKATSAEVKAQLISTGIGALVVILGEAISLIYKLVDAFSVSDKDISESVSNVSNALEEYSNAKTQYKGAASALKQYKELSSMVYLTAVEQEKLNNLAQELGDALDIEVIEDKYGNLTVSIEDAEEAVESLQQKMADARKELADTENEEIEKYDHNGNVDRFYDEYLKANKSKIRDVVDDIDTGIDPKQLATDAQSVKSIMNNLKNVIIDDSHEMAEAFGGLGIEWSLTEDVESMIQQFQDANISPEKWNELYRTFDTLQGQIDNISYDRALEVVEGAITSWGEAAGLTTQQLNLMTDAIMNSLYGSSNLNKRISGYQDIIDKYNGTYYDSEINSIKKRRDQLYKESNSMWNPFKQDDAEREYESLGKKIDMLEEEQFAYQQIAYWQDIVNNPDATEEQKQYAESMIQYYEELYDVEAKDVEMATRMKNLLGKFSDNSAAAFDAVGLFDEDATNILDQLEQSGRLDEILGAFKIDENTGTKTLTDSLVEIINNTNDEDLKDAATKKLNKVFDNITIKGTMKWGDLSKELDSLSSDLRKMNQLMEDFNDTGGFTLETFADLCDILDSIDLSAVFDAGKMDQYIGALENLQLGFDASTGAITANGEAMRSLQDIQEVMTQAKLKQTAQSLEADKAELQSEIWSIEAEIAANNALIQWLSKQSDVEIEIDKLKKEGQIDYNNTMQQAATLTAQQYQDMLTASSKWSQASITNAAKVGEAIKKAMTGELGTDNLKAYLDGLVSEMYYENTGSYNQLLLLQEKKNGKNVVNRDKAISALQDYNVKGQNTIDELYSKMKNIEQMQNLLNTMSTADLSKLGTSGGKGKEMEQYIGKLKEIYNILNRIQVLEHRLSTLDSYADIAQGEMYGALLKERVDYNKELLDQYQFLTTEQKQFTNGYKDFIQSVEGLEGVFEFDKFGQIIINWEKYNALQDEAVDGETSLKEKADDVYETYTNMFEDLQGYFDKTIDYYKAVIDLQQEMVDSYVDMQNQAADAIQEIYQKILDTKLDAINQEKEALEELKKARDEANKDKSDAKAVAGLQTNLQRAMLDTSGASDSAAIKAQQDLDDKLDAIAEDKYSQMLEDLQEQLEDEQEALQNNFDDLFENLEWLFTWLDDDIMGDQTALFDLLKQTDDWQHTSFLERKGKMDEWQTKFYSYYDGMTKDEKGIYGIYDNITQTKAQINTLDTNLQASISKGSAEIAQTIANWQNKTSSSNGGSGGAGGGSGNTTTTNKTTNTNNLTSSYQADITGLDNNLSDTTKKEKQPKYTSGFAPGDTVTVKDGSMSLTTKYNSNFQAVGSTAGWNLSNVRVKQVAFDKKNEQFFYQFDKFGDWWYKGWQFNKVKDGGGEHMKVYKRGGLVNNTGPAWLDGTSSQPEAVLNALQTKHFIDFTQSLDKMYSTPTGAGISSNSNINIGTITFSVASMSSEEDGEKAFNMFVEKFKEIGSHTGLNIENYKNDL